MGDEALVNGRYLLKSALGSGGMGSVYLAEDLARPGTLVALKRVPPQGYCADKALIEALIQEFETLSRLRHPNLPAVHDFGRIEGTSAVFLSMDHVQGEDLDSASARLSAEQALSIVAQICRALEFIHTRGLVHRDLKPQNILVSGLDGGEPRAVLVDFGLASEVSDQARMKGSVHFVAPEILKGGRLDRRADLYALGVLLYKLSTGRCPFEGPSQEILKGHLEGVPARPLDVPASGAPAPLRPHIGEPLSALILKLLEKDPARRYRSAAETLQALNRATGADHPIETPDTGDAYSASAALVGREEAVSRLEAALARLGARLEQGTTGRDSSLVVVEGEAGIGKSRFLAEAKRRAQVAGIHAVTVSCAADLPAFQPVAEAISLLGVSAGLDAEARAEAPGDSSEKARLRAVDSAATKIAERARNRPVALFIDDAHLADEGSLAVCEALARDVSRAPGLAIILAYRPEELEGAPLESSLARVRRASRLEEIRLGLLDRQQTAQMIGGMLGLSQAAEELVDLVFKETSGNPLFIEQAVRSLLEDGTIARIGVEFRADVDALTHISFPTGVGEAIRRRLSRLPENALKLLEILSVIQRPADLDLILHAADGGASEEALKAELAGLRRRRIVEEESPAVGGRFFIANARTRDVIYERIDWDRRRQLHHRVATSLKERAGKGLRIRYEELARHFIHGADPATALEYALGAAERCKRMGAAAEARAFYARGLELVPQGADAERAEILTKIGIIDREYGRDAEATEAFDRAHRASSKAGRRDLAALALLEKAELFLGRSRTEEVVREVERALEVLQGVDDLSLRARAYSYLASSYAQTGKVERALELQRRALEAAERSGDDRRLASALNNLGSLQILSKKDEEGYASLERSIETWHRSGDAHGGLVPLNNLGSMLAKAGRFEKAAEYLERAVDLARRVEDLRLLVEIQVNLGGLRAGTGCHDLALISYEEAAAVAMRIGLDSLASYALDGWGQSLLTLGDVEGATARHVEALDRARRTGLASQEMFAMGSLALDHAAAGEFGKAREAIRKAARMNGASGAGRARLRWVEAGILADLESGAVVEAEKATNEMRELAVAERSPQKECQALYLTGRAAELKGEPETALRVFTQAADLARSHRAGEGLWRPLAAAARIHEMRGDLPAARAACIETREMLQQLAGRIADEEMRRLYLAAPERHAVMSQVNAVDTLSFPFRPSGSALEALYRISGIITSAADLDDLLARLLDLALEIVKAERGLIILVTEDGERQEVRAARGVEPETITDALEYSHSVVRESAAGRTLVMLDPESEASFQKFRSVSLFQIKSLACVPMKVRDKVLGTVYLDSRREGYLFRDEDLEFLKAFSNLAGAALEMARLNVNLSKENVTLQREVQDLRKAAGKRSRYQELVGKTVRMQAVYDMLDKVSDSPLPVLVTGESGTGKELVARAVHFGGARRNRKFFSENVAAIPDTLLESELFGHVRGAFTGADRDRKGVFELADGGTLFLDEIGDMSLHLQSKVLRALQDGEIRPLGAKESLKVDVRVISATNRNLEAMIDRGEFREDLYYRLNVIKIHMPALRDRKEDIPILVDHFLERAAEGSPQPKKRLDISALQLLLRYDWPGNVRELENEILKLTVMAPGDVITQQDVSGSRDLFEKLTRIGGKAGEFTTLDAMERRQIEMALLEAGGNRAKAAQLLGISRATIYRKLREHGISA